VVARDLLIAGAALAALAWLAAPGGDTPPGARRAAPPAQVVAAGAERPAGVSFGVDSPFGSGPAATDLAPVTPAAPAAFAAPPAADAVTAPSAAAPATTAPLPWADDPDGWSLHPQPIDGLATARRAPLWNLPDEPDEADATPADETPPPDAAQFDPSPSDDASADGVEVDATEPADD
jgi:hypothetical protein